MEMLLETHAESSTLTGTHSRVRGVPVWGTCSVTMLAEVGWAPHVTVQRGLGMASGPKASARSSGAVLLRRGLSTGLAEASQHLSGPRWLGLSHGDRFTPPWKKGGNFQIS